MEQDLHGYLMATIFFLPPWLSTLKVAALLSICLEDTAMTGVSQRHFHFCDGPMIPVPRLLMPGQGDKA
jgi:hypothetical protein